MSALNVPTYTFRMKLRSDLRIYFFLKKSETIKLLMESVKWKFQAHNMPPDIEFISITKSFSSINCAHIYIEHFAFNVCLSSDSYAHTNSSNRKIMWMRMIETYTHSLAVCRCVYVRNMRFLQNFGIDMISMECTQLEMHLCNSKMSTNRNNVLSQNHVFNDKEFTTPKISRDMT